MISQTLLNELSVIIEQDYGVKLRPKEVSELGNNLVGFFELLLKIEGRSKNDNENSGNPTN